MFSYCIFFKYSGTLLKKKEWVELGNECYLNETVHLTCFRLRPSLQEIIQDADFVISHAGAGTALELLSHQVQ
jgi:UDP-N-acetylglucosamine transferase subunit ALG13